MIYCANVDENLWHTSKMGRGQGNKRSGRRSDEGGKSEEKKKERVL